MSNTRARDCWIAWFWNTPLVVYVAFPCTVKVINCLSICFFFWNTLFIYLLWHAHFFIVFFNLNRPISLCLKSARNLGTKSSYPSHPQKEEQNLELDLKLWSLNDNRKEIREDTRNINSAYGGPLWCVCGVPIILAPTKTKWFGRDISSPCTQPTMVHSLVTILKRIY